MSRTDADSLILAVEQLIGQASLIGRELALIRSELIIANTRSRDAEEARHEDADRTNKYLEAIAHALTGLAHQYVYAEATHCPAESSSGPVMTALAILED